MSTPTPRKVAPSIRDPNSVFERETRRLLETFNSAPLANGILITGISLTGNTAQVPHQLSRPYKGFLVVDQTAGGMIWRDLSFTSNQDTIIPLKASTTMTVSLWVF